VFFYLAYLEELSFAFTMSFPSFFISNKSSLQKGLLPFVLASSQATLAATLRMDTVTLPSFLFSLPRSPPKNNGREKKWGRYGTRLEKVVNTTDGQPNAPADPRVEASWVEIGPETGDDRRRAHFLQTDAVLLRRSGKWQDAKRKRNRQEGSLFPGE